jgi:hypothetical protein
LYIPLAHQSAHEAENWHSDRYADHKHIYPEKIHNQIICNGAEEGHAQHLTRKDDRGADYSEPPLDQKSLELPRRIHDFTLSTFVHFTKLPQVSS